MPEITTFDTFNDFAEFNFRLIDSNPFLYFHLQRTIERVFNRKVALNRFFNIVENNNWVSVLWVKDECLIFSSGETTNMISEVAKGLDFGNFKSHMFLGTKTILDALFDSYSVRFKEQKHRNFYSCQKVIEPFEYASGQAFMGKLKRSQELTEMSIAFHKEFYDNQYNPENPSANIVNSIGKYRSLTATVNIHQSNRLPRINPTIKKLRKAVWWSLGPSFLMNGYNLTAIS